MEFPAGSTPVALLAVSHAPLKKYHALVVDVPVKSSLTVVWAGAARGNTSAATAMAATVKLLRFIHSPVRLTTP